MGQYGALKRLDTPVIKKCEVCGKTFECINVLQASHKKYCSDECKRERDNENARKNYKKRKKKTDICEHADTFAKKEKRRRSSEEDLTKDAVAARQAGLTYGQYMARKYAPRINPH